MPSQPVPGTASPLQQTLRGYLLRACPDAARQIEQSLAAFIAAPSRAAFFRLVAMAPRWTGRRPMSPTATEREALSALHSNLHDSAWDEDQLARLWIMATVQNAWPATTFVRELDTLFNTADTGELVALYRSLALLREPRQFIARAREGARSNMVTVFQAVAHHNSFAAQYFDDEGWNQLVLKAVFNACDLDSIVGLDQRSNPALCHMLSDYVRERWAASRDVPWDIWRCIGPHAHQTGDADLLAAALSSADRLTQLAAALALRDSGAPGALELLESHPDIYKATAGMNWHGLAALAKGD